MKHQQEHSWLRTYGLILLSLGLILLLAQAFVPLEQFIHRGDDAYYYFNMARNYAEVGFWTFDRIHPSNGVQPLWAIVLTLIAQACHGVGIEDADVMARVFVAITVLLHFASCAVLFDLLSRTVSTGTAIAAAGAFLFPMGIVWLRAWGMENSLYAFMLLATISYFHRVYLQNASTTTALSLGLLLGLTALSRLNAGLFVAILLSYSLYRLHGTALRQRLRLGVIAGCAALLVIGPYLFWNHHTTGHLLPVSGAVKTLATASYMQAHGIESRFSWRFLSAVYWDFFPSIRWFVASRAGDGLWALGGRVLFSGHSRIATDVLVPILGGLLLLPLLAGQPKQWLALVRERLSRLAAFWYVAAFGILNAALSVVLYPTQLRYAMTRWWLVENEIVITVLVAALVAAFAAHFARRWVPQRRQLGAVGAVLLVLVILHAQQTARHYWGDKTVFYDWNASWNDESYKAAKWLGEHVAPEAKVGSWNAGVLGYYAKHRVVNLDGLINNFDLLPYLEKKRVVDYIKNEGIEYLSDMEGMFSAERVTEGLKLTEVYSSRSPLIGQHYRIYKVEGDH